jgi:hypothetical protein
VSVQYCARHRLHRSSLFAGGGTAYSFLEDQTAVILNPEGCITCAQVPGGHGPEPGGGGGVRGVLLPHHGRARQRRARAPAFTSAIRARQAPAGGPPARPQGTYSDMAPSIRLTTRKLVAEAVKRLAYLIHDQPSLRLLAGSADVCCHERCLLSSMPYDARPFYIWRESGVMML